MMHPNPARLARVAGLAVIALVALVGAGCSNKVSSSLLPNQAPEVRLTAAPLVFDRSRPDFYAYTIQWVGFDPDGRVDHFLYAVDPESLPYNPRDTVWHATVKNEQTFFFSADSTIAPVDVRDPRSESPHVFAVYAVDNGPNGGKLSARPAARAFYSYTQAPIVSISDPIPNSSFGLNLTPSVRITWTGSDPDGQFTTKPVRWVFRLFTKINPDFPSISDYVTFAQLQGDSMRKQYMPGAIGPDGQPVPTANFKGWNKVGADTTSFQYTNLSANQAENPEYLFAVTGFDEAGAYDPIFETGKNMLRFSVNFASTAGPLIRMYNQFFDYTYPFGGFDENNAFHLEVPADRIVTFNWDAFASPGADISRFRWVLDLVDLDDETARQNENEWSERHWSAWSRSITSAKIGPFTINGENHKFYIEAEDNNELQSLGVIDFTVVKANWETAADLLIVDDTRLAPDQQPVPSLPIEQPVGAWPMAAELDTFLFARGGVPWRVRPPGSISTPGIFNGYDFDTLGTRGRSLDGLVPLSVLVQYRHIVWLIDPAAATYTLAPTDQSAPISSLRLCNAPGRPAILSTYMIQGLQTTGGYVWIVGGGGAVATLGPYNNLNNGLSTYSRDFGELQEGRLMFDYAHWREEITILPATRANKFAPGNAYGVGDNRPNRGWPPNPTPPTPPGPPDYSILPLNLNPKNGVDDPPPPGRVDPFTGITDPNFFVGNYSAEYISQPSFVFEDYLDGEGEAIYSTLDTLYVTRGGSAARDKPVMTYYHGRECQPFVFSGFNLWYWRRPDCIALVDFVLGSVWGLHRDPSAPRYDTAPAARHRQRASR